MNVVLLGAGHWHAERIYVPIVRDLGLRIAGVHDDDPAVRERRREQWGVPVFADASELLERTRPDFAFCLGPHADMPRLALPAAERGIPFLVEKPAGIRAVDVETLAARCDDRNVFAAVAFAYRWNPGLRAVRDLLAEGRLGRVARVALQYFAGPPSRYVDDGCAWMLDPRRSGGGCLMNIGTHLVDALHFFGFEPEYVHGASCGDIHRLEIEDVSCLVVRMGEAYGLIECGYCPRAGDKEFAVSVTAERGNLEYDLSGLLRVSWADGTVEERRHPTPSVYAEMLRDVLEAAAAGRPPPVGLHDMVKVLRVLDRFYDEIRV